MAVPFLSWIGSAAKWLWDKVRGRPTAEAHDQAVATGDQATIARDQGVAVGPGHTGDIMVIQRGVDKGARDHDSAATASQLGELRQTIAELEGLHEVGNFQQFNFAWLLLRLETQLAVGLDSRLLSGVGEKLGLGSLLWREIMAKYILLKVVRGDYYAGKQGVMSSYWEGSYNQYHLTEFGIDVIRELRKNPPTSPTSVFRN